MLNKKYLSQQNAIASYSSVDVLDGVGYINFYPCAFKLSGSTTYGVAQSTGLASGKVVQKIVGAAPTPTTINYDLVFNKPQSIKGKLLLSYSLGIGIGNGGAGTQVFTIAKIYKVSSATTQLGATITNAALITNAGDKSMTAMNSFDLSDQVYIFKAGDILRVQIYLAGGGGSTTTYGYGQDPAATADAADAAASPAELQCITSGYTTRMTIAVPFILDL